MDDGLQGYSLVESPLDLPEATPDEQPEANNAVTAEDTSEERGAVELANDVGIGSPKEEEKPDEIDLELLDISKRLFELLVAIRKKPIRVQKMTNTALMMMPQQKQKKHEI